MPDRPRIFTGLLIFLGLITFPVWYNLAAKTTSRGPDLKLPAREKQCVAPVDYMKTSHMDFLVGWREDVVRRGIRSFHSQDGRAFQMSLTGTCLQQCHGARKEFCDRCHTYAGVKGPYCWDCHVDAPLLSRDRQGAVPPRTTP